MATVKAIISMKKTGNVDGFPTLGTKRKIPNKTVKGRAKQAKFNAMKDEVHIVQEDGTVDIYETQKIVNVLYIEPELAFKYEGVDKSYTMPTRQFDRFDELIS